MTQEHGNKKMKKPLSLCLYLLWIIACICLFLYFASKCIRYNFGEVTIAQLLIHLSIETNVELPESFIKSIAKYAILFFVSSGVLLYFTYISVQKKLYHIKIKKTKSFNISIPLCAVVLIMISLYTIVRFDHRLHIIDYLTKEESVFFTDNYYKLDIDNIVPSNKNLLVLFIESLEDGYKDSSVYKANLIQGLDNLKKEGISFSNYIKTPGAYYTMDGICAQLLGVPVLHISQGRINKHDSNHKSLYGKPLLENTPSIFNLLKNMSYETIAFSGASKNFTYKGAHFKVHGIDTFLGKEYWDEKGFGQDIANKGSDWGFNDEFLFNRLKKYLTHRTSDKKFAIFFETLDTHIPAGFVTDEDRRFKDMRDCVIRTSRLITEFIDWSKQQTWYNNTVIVIVGDHPWPDFPIPGTLSDFTKQSRNRQIFNLILNSEAQPVREIKGWSSMDMAPTILHAMGIAFTSHDISANASHTNMGIGVSLFSGETTLVEKYGEKFFSEELLKPNKLYDSLL